MIVNSKKPDIVLSKVVKWYLLFMGDSSIIKQPLLKRLLAMVPIFYLVTSVAIIACVYSKPLNFSLSDLVYKMHGVVRITTELLCFFWWWNRALLREVVHELTDLMIFSQVPVDSEIRHKIIEKCEARSTFVLWFYSAMTVLVSIMYTVAPIIIYLLDTSPDKKLPMPLGMCEPFSKDGGGGEGLSRGLVYLCFSVCLFGFVYIWFHGAVIHFIILDSLKTLFYLSSLAFFHLGDTNHRHPDHAFKVIRFHQRLLRLSSKVKTLIEPLSAIGVFSFAFYNVIGGLAVTTQHVSSDVYVFLVTMVGFTVPVFIVFSISASTTDTAAEISSRVYFNNNWVARRFEPSTFFPFIIMRAEKLVKFRIFNCWVLSLPNFVQYVNHMYSFFTVLSFVTSRSQKELD